MRYIILFIFLLLLFHSSSHAADSTFYKITIVQGKDSFSASQNNKSIIVLNPKPFKFMIQMVGLRDISLMASHKSSLYDVEIDSPIKDCEYIGINTGAGENNYNKTKQLALYEDGDGFSYWFYDPSEGHRFDKQVIKNKDTLIVTHTVESFWYVPSYSGKAVSEDTRDLYIVFLRPEVESCETYKREKVSDRRYIKIQFQNK